MRKKFTRFASLVLVGILVVLYAVGCSTPEKVVVCKECDEENPKGAKFCMECGAELSSSKKGNSNEGEDDSNKGSSNKGGSSDKWLLLESYVESTGYTLKYYYDSNGYLVGQESWSDSFDLRSQTIYTNDSKGNCTLMYIPLYAQLGFDANITFKNTYDNEGRLVKAYNEDWETYDQYYYEGDELIKVVHVEEDGEESYKEYEDGKLIRTFEDGTTTDYYYDKNGKCTGTSNESLTVDENGNITKDASQTYKYITLKEYLAQNLHNNSYTQSGSSNNGGDATTGGNSNNNGGNNNSNNNNGVTPSICSACSGSGRGRECIGCDGTGKALSYYDINDKPVYKTCLGCKGRGYISCAYCGGDGYR